MGRGDAVQVILEVNAYMRRIEPRLRITYEAGWETRGNGSSANYEGGIVHHTASRSSLSNPFPTQTLLRVGRSDLPGPLCNHAGPACTVEAPWIHVMAAHPANHAGASGGRSMGPLPVTSLFNPRVLGLEIDYAGLAPMLDGQLYVAHLWSRAVAAVVGFGDIQRIRAHMETSVTGKWDPGYADGRTIDMAAFRRDAAAIKSPTPATPTLGEDEMLLIRNTPGTVVLLGDGFALWVSDNPSNAALQAKLGKPVQVSDAFFNTVVKAAERSSRIESNLAGILKDLADEEPAVGPGPQ